MQGANYIHREKPLVSEKIKGNYDLQFTDELSSYRSRGDLTKTRKIQWQCTQVQLALVSGQRTDLGKH